MTELELIILGALLTLLTSFILERWKYRRSSQAAALLISRELEFHKMRLEIVKEADQYQESEYDMLFPAEVWSAQNGSLVTGVSPKRTEAILNWYGSMAVLGNVLSRRNGPEGPQLSGPDRERLNEALEKAYEAAIIIAEKGGVFSSKLIRSNSLFEPTPGSS